MGRLAVMLSCGHFTWGSVQAQAVEMRSRPLLGFPRLDHLPTRTQPAPRGSSWNSASRGSDETGPG